MQIVIITQDDIFYICEFLRPFLRKTKKAGIFIPLVVILHPFNEDIQALAKRMYRFYGLSGFLRRGIQYARLKLLDRLGFAKRSVRSIAAEYDIPVRRVTDINDPALVAELQRMHPDVILSVSAPQIFRKGLLQVPKWGCVNIHSAELPKYRGMMPNFWAMYHGDQAAGITIHRMAPKIDRGRILVQTEIPIHQTESLDSLIKRSKRAAADLTIRALEQIRAGTVQLKDYEGESSYFSFPKREHVRDLRAKGHRLL